MIYAGAQSMLVSLIWVCFFTLSNLSSLFLGGFIYGVGITLSYSGLIHYKQIIIKLFTIKRKSKLARE